jgi:ADP-heptose:LPS heptosyltransferase
MLIRSAKAFLPVIFRALRSRPDDDQIRKVLDNPHKILLVKQSERLGNIVLLNSAIAGLVAAFPGIRVDFLLPAAYADVIMANFRIGRIIPVQKRAYIGKPWKMLHLIRELRLEKYDLALDCSDMNSHSATGALYTILAGAQITAGWQMAGRRIFDIEVPRYADSVHAVEMYVRLVSGVFGREFHGEPYFDEALSQADPTSLVVGINCGGRGSKRWPLESFLDVGTRLAKRGINVEFILGPEENGLRQSLQDRLPENGRLLPSMPLPQLTGKIKSFRAFISSDTGPMHLAWCLRVPVIAIFLDSEIEKFRPLSPGSVAMDGKSGITPDDIFAASMKILASRQVAA